MNPTLLATLGTLAETASLKADILPPVSGENAPAFTLPKMAVAAVAERVHSAKTSQQQATRPQENDPVAMQALMALLLPQPAAPHQDTPQPRVSTQPARPKSELTRVTARPQVERKTEKVPDSEPVIARAVLQVKTPELLSDHQEIVAKPATLSMDELGEKLTTLLKDQIHFQLNKQQQISTIRLDPPSLGKLEIAVQLDNGKLMVHIGANQSEVCRALQQFSDDLRQHLTAQNFMEVNVQVSSEGQSQQQQQSGHQQEEVSAALQLDDAPQFQQNESVLIKV
ncbi:flagellar hook-length control protein FliK [Escherichia coli]|uniref:flagellar hook-length control protein FliK n=1 Tax=Escherichia coli TaxID=562 RepID=UPI0004D61525|nr:flagellar hook-length control protein FliK [Escherichia coli]EET8682479.1 flagellar hook-length control protein FliK [Escherichia coli]EEU0908962.1 flagellar hook-length control protein FliK [Escherichia coli]EEU0911541.1 flagellar hook-length control protein FliK [Escherichia coli]EEW5759717.1 flagellar hook-length control protein FliK [Escherichia coli]EEX4254192.1 flagellar hook-length control protein FliK [Escherichia coli]